MFQIAITTKITKTVSIFLTILLRFSQLFEKLLKN